MAVVAKYCPEIKVTVVDINKERIQAWNSKNLNNLPIFEPGLMELIQKIRDKNLFFSIDIKNSIKEADMIFISVNTPTKKSGLGAGYASDLKWVEESARKVSQYSEGHTIVVEKSTVPVKTAELIKTILMSNKSNPKDPKDNRTYSVLSSPEFLAEGTAIKDLENPDRVLVGGEDKNAIFSLTEIYKKWIPEEKILLTNLWSSELSKLTANAFLAQRISSINSISALCEATGAQINEVSNAIGSDQRIGKKFLEAGPGFGGSCFQKDILNLVYICKYYGLDQVADYWDHVIKLNNWQRERISNLIVEKFFGTVSDKKIVILGFAFKANTNDFRESAALYIAKELLENGANLLIHDPKVSYDQINKNLEVFVKKVKSEKRITFSENLNESFHNADAIIILTEWAIYKNLNWKKIALNLRHPSWIFDTRSIINKSDIKDLGINLWTVGDGEFIS
tara:strand:+ start:3747 stop:5102 length:1356 start_codon:yes stop_codon:yes gene_type:complete